MKSLIPFLLAWSVSAGCASKDPDLARATQAFEKRYPEYVIQASRIVSTEEGKKAVVVEFDAPKNAKNRGRADLVLEKGTNGSWEIVNERVNLWKH